MPDTKIRGLEGDLRNYIMGSVVPKGAMACCAAGCFCACFFHLVALLSLFRFLLTYPNIVSILRVSIGTTVLSFCLVVKSTKLSLSSLT